MRATEKIAMRVEVEEDAVVLVLPRLLDDCPVPWQDAYQLGETLELAAADVPVKPAVINPLAVQLESEQVRLNRHKNLVVLLFGHVDRVRLSPEAARIVGRAIKRVAQDVEYALRDIHFVYDRRGLLRKLVNQKVGYTQHVR